MRLIVTHHDRKTIERWQLNKFEAEYYLSHIATRLLYGIEVVREDRLARYVITGPKDILEFLKREHPWVTLE